MNAKQYVFWEPVQSFGNHDFGPDGDFDHRLNVTVLATSAEGTVSALRTARRFSKSLGARITLLMMEEVPFRIPLDSPLVPVEFREWWLCSLLAKSGVAEEEANVEIVLCRDRKRDVQKTLLPHSLVVVGGKRSWWSRSERNLEKLLRDLGHSVIFVPADRHSEFRLFPLGGFLRIPNMSSRESSR